MTNTMKNTETHANCFYVIGGKNKDNEDFNTLDALFCRTQKAALIEIGEYLTTYKLIQVTYVNTYTNKCEDITEEIMANYNQLADEYNPRPLFTMMIEVDSKEHIKPFTDEQFNEVQKMVKMGSTYKEAWLIIEERAASEATQ